jgi:formate-dependent nitrite reductase membrane component NrfD
MGTKTKVVAGQTADAAKERRLIELRREAEQAGRVLAPGVRAAGGPMPEQAALPAATPNTGYYGLPLLKRPTWIWTIPLYFLVGGAAGAAAIIAAVARWTRGNDAPLVRDARRIAIAGGAISPVLLTADLGRPARFLYMLRVFKRQSPMSVGAWLLASFNATTIGAKLLRLIGQSSDRRLLKGTASAAGDAAETAGAVLGGGMATYTGVLIGVTAIPVWARNARLLPFHFGMSGFSTASCLLELLHDDPALHRINLVGAVGETLVGMRLELDHDRKQDPLKHGRSGTLIRLGGLLSGPAPLAIRLLAGGSRNGRRSAALLSLAGSVVTRFAWLDAGQRSSEDPRIPLGLRPPDAPSSDRPDLRPAISGVFNAIR